MVFEETLTFHDVEAGEKFARYVRDSGMKARSVHTKVLDRQGIVDGTIEAFIAVFSEEVEGADEVEEEEEDLNSVYEVGLVKAKELKEIYGEFVESHTPGEVLDLSIEKEYFDLFKRSQDEGDDESEALDILDNEFSDDFTDWIRVRNLLHRNGLVEENEDGDLVLLSHKDPNEMLTSFPLFYIDGIEDELIEKSDLWPRITITSQEVCQVTIGADVIVGMGVDDIARLSRFLCSTTYDVEEDLFESISIKKIVIERMLAVIYDRGSATAMEVFEAVNAEPEYSPGTVLDLDLNVALDYVREGLKEMQKTRLIQKSGAGFRIASMDRD